MRYTDPSHMEPLLPGSSGSLSSLACRIIAEAGKLEGQLRPDFKRELRELLRVVNSYYSNLIEGHGTRPVDIYRAMNHDFSSEPTKRDLQEESIAHIETQKWMDDYLAEKADCKITDTLFLQQLHAIFYQHAPEAFRHIQHDGETIALTPGEFRMREVQVGKHIAPIHSALPRFMQSFQRLEPSKYHGEQQLIACAAAHHRLA